jgi:hypothetical protein
MMGRDNMDEAELAMRKFLKHLGVTAHQELASALAKAVANGALAPGDEVPVTARIEIQGVTFSHEVNGNLIAPK